MGNKASHVTIESVLEGLENNPRVDNIEISGDVVEATMVQSISTVRGPKGKQTLKVYDGTGVIEWTIWYEIEEGEPAPFDSRFVQIGDKITGRGYASIYNNVKQFNTFPGTFPVLLTPVPDPDAPTMLDVEVKLGKKQKDNNKKETTSNKSKSGEPSVSTALVEKLLSRFDDLLQGIERISTNVERLVSILDSKEANKMREEFKQIIEP